MVVRSENACGGARIRLRRRNVSTKSTRACKSPNVWSDAARCVGRNANVRTLRASCDARPFVLTAAKHIASAAVLTASVWSVVACSHIGGNTQPTPTPVRRLPTPYPSGPIFAGGRPARTVLHSAPLGVSPDGVARWLVRVAFVDAAGKATRVLHGGNVDFFPSRGLAQWQTRLRFDGPAAIVSTSTDGPLALAIVPHVGVDLGVSRAVTDTRQWTGPRVVASALGPHLAQIGWFPAPPFGTVRIGRASLHARPAVTLAAARDGTFRDPTVLPGITYRYRVEVPGRRPAFVVVNVPHMPRHGSLTSIAGKAMWLSFSPSQLDVDAYSQLEPSRVAERASAAGLRAIVLRTGYGPYWEITPQAKPTIDALIDAVAARGIAVVGWTVPRAVEYDDLAAAVRTAAYRTPRGNGFAALAVDLERGDEYLGSGAAGYSALKAYLRLLRAALGRSYPLIATVEDPYLEHLSNDVFPYATIAASADALQPMTYWRMLSKNAITPQTVRRALRGSYAATRREAGRDIPIDVGGQTSPVGPRGAPLPDEIAASTREARALGAVGITFFDWAGTNEAQWRALAQTPWRP